MSRPALRVSPRVAGLCGLAAPPFAFALIFLTIHLNSSWFSWTDNALSDLGDASRSPSHLVYDAALLGAALLMVPLLRVLLSRVRGGLDRTGAAIFGAGVASLAGIGLFPEPTPPHLPFSVAFFSLTPLGLLLLAAGLRRAEERWALFSLVCALAAGAVWALPYPGEGVAIPEALSAGLMSAWVMALGARLLREGAPGGTRPSQSG